MRQLWAQVGFFNLDGMNFRSAKLNDVMDCLRVEENLCRATRQSWTQYSHELGVGDAEGSYAYDGQRVKKWNCGCADYGESWVTGDVIGCLLDLDAGIISFARNGRLLGPAFENIPHQLPGCCYYPGVSLSSSEKCSFNFGGVPFRYPIDGYAPIQLAPPPALVEDAAQLLRNLHILCQKLPHADAPHLTVIDMALLIKQLAPLIAKPYICQRVFLPFLLELNTCDTADELSQFMSTLLSLFEAHERFLFVPQLVGILSSLTHNGNWTSQNVESIDMLHPVSCLELAVTLFDQSDFMNAWLQACCLNKSVRSGFRALFSVREIHSNDLAVEFPHVYVLGSEASSEEDRVAFHQQTQALVVISERLEAARKHLVDIFLKNDVPVQSPVSVAFQVTVSAKNWFQAWFKELVSVNVDVPQFVKPKGLCDQQTLRNVMFAVAGTLRIRFQSLDMVTSDTPADDDSVLSIGCLRLPTNYFAEDRTDTSRLGGVYSHLVRKQAEEEKGAAPSAPAPGRWSGNKNWEHLNALPSSKRSGSESSSAQPQFHTTEVELLILCIHLMNDVGSVAVRALSLESAEQKQCLTLLSETVEAMANPLLNTPEHATVMEHLRMRCEAFTEEAKRGARLEALHKSSLLTSERTGLLLFMLQFSANVLKSFSATKYFPFLPEFLITALRLLVLLGKADDARLIFKNPDAAACASDILTCLVTFVADERLVNPDLRDMLLEQLSQVILVPTILAILETTEVARKGLFVGLLKTFDDKRWVTIVAIILRVFRGASRPLELRPGLEGLSSVLQAEFRPVCDGDRTLTKSLLNTMLNILNWLLTEFGEYVQQIDEGAVDIVQSDLRVQRNFSIMFEMSASMLTVLDIIAEEIADISYLDDKESSIYLKRLLELLLAFFVRISPKTPLGQAFGRVLDMKIPSMKGADPNILFAALFSEFANLQEAAASSSSPNAVLDMLIDEPSFDVNLFKMVTTDKAIGFSKSEYVSKSLNERIKGFIKGLTQRVAERQAIQENKADEDLDDENTCTICYAALADAEFVPCGHRSCTGCITRHLMNEKACFFCKEMVKEVKTVSKI